MIQNINMQLIPVKAHYFFFYSGIAPVILFMSTYSKQLGFSPGVVGLIYTILPIMGMIGKLLMGTLADKFQTHKFVHLCFILLTVNCFFGIIFVPELKEAVSHNMIQCSSNNFSVVSNNLTIDNLICENTRNTVISKCRIDCCSGVASFNETCFSKSKGKRLPTQNLVLNSQFNSYNKIVFIGEVESFENEQLFQSIILKKVKLNNENLAALISTIKEKSKCIVACENNIVSEIDKIENEYNSLFTYQFWLFLTLMTFGWIGSAVVTCVGDTICFNYLGDKSNEYGNQRLWGSVGWGICAPIVGILVDYNSIGQNEKNYMPLFYLVALLLSIDAIVSLFFKETERPPSENIVKEIRSLFFNFRILLFFTWCILVGIGACMIWNFLFWHLEELAGCNQKWIKTLEGLLVCFKSYLGEIPFFFLNSWLLKKLGHINCMTLVLFTFGVKFLLYSILVNPWWSLPIELLSGLTFSTFYATMASYASILAPTGTEATLQGIVGSLYEGVGISLGSLIGGLFLEYFESAVVFRFYGFASLMFCALHFVIHCIIGQTPANNFHSLQSEESLLEEPHINLYSEDNVPYSTLVE